jgi:hypothetical protein
MPQSIGQVAVVVRDYDEALGSSRSYKAKGVTFIREPKEEAYGTVAVFQDLYGNLWDLLQSRNPV